MPAIGIYATVALVGGVYHPAVTSIGVRPTVVEAGPVTVETFLLDGEHDLYGKRLRLAFVKWIRAEARFDDLSALKAQMAMDCAKARRFLRASVSRAGAEEDPRPSGRPETHGAAARRHKRWQVAAPKRLEGASAWPRTARASRLRPGVPEHVAQNRRAVSG